MANKDITGLIKKLNEQGFEVERAKNNHWTVRKNGRRVTTLPSTPSDHRTMKNCLAYLKREGFKP
ncbi:hypothetical protein [Streptomyces venezuelae]|uniref:hypothetical protein n=1 Tax=Streptomyces venezuelae TaxID=54571 RepID=UPI003441FDBE